MNNSVKTTEILGDTNRLVNLLSSSVDLRSQIPAILRGLCTHLGTDKGFLLETAKVPDMPDQLVYYNFTEAEVGGKTVFHQIPEPLSQTMFSETVLKSWLIELVKLTTPATEQGLKDEQQLPAYLLCTSALSEAVEKIKRNAVCKNMMRLMNTSFYDFLGVPVIIDHEVRGFFLTASGPDHHWSSSAITMSVTIIGLLSRLMTTERTKDMRLIRENHSLKKSERHYRRFIRNSNDGIYYIKCGQPIPINSPVAEQVKRYYQHAYIEECNDTLAREHGYGDRTELLGHRLADLHTDEKYREGQNSFRLFVESNYRIKNFITQETAINGKSFYSVNNAVGVIEDDCLIGVWGVQRNIVTPLGISSSEATFLAVLQALPDIKIRVDQSGTVLAMYGFSRDKMGLKLRHEVSKEQNISEILPVFIAQGLLFNVRKCLESNRLEHFEFMIPKENGTQDRYYEGRINRINASEAIIILRNITKLKKAEKALTEQINQVDQKNRQLQRYIESNLQLENFAYVASHDLREPVRTMRTFGQFLKRRAGNRLDEESLSHLDFIIDGAERMNLLIEDLLTYSRVNADTNTDDPVELKLLLEEIKESLNVAIKETGAKIIYRNLPQVIQGNRIKLLQLFQNLLANAVKFHRKGVPPTIIIAARETKTHWRFSIADNGIGIESLFHEQIFVIFKKLHNHQEYQGSGIGLTLVRKVVEQHGGNIWVESEVGKGTTFHFTLKK